MTSLKKLLIEKVAANKEIKMAYKAPKLVKLGSSVELVQGNGNSVYQDGRGYYYRTR
jgi:hypothetical protein